MIFSMYLLLGLVQTSIIIDKSVLQTDPLAIIAFTLFWPFFTILFLASLAITFFQR